MATQIPFHEVISGDHLQCDEWWFLIREDDGTRYVVYERQESDPATKAPSSGGKYAGTLQSCFPRARAQIKHREQ